MGYFLECDNFFKQWTLFKSSEIVNYKYWSRLIGTNTVNPQLLNNRLSNNKKFKLPTSIKEDFKIRREIINHLRRKKDNFINKILRYF